MPTYEYLCKKCGNSFDVFQSFSDKPLKKHEDCGGDLQKVFHARGIVFKGSGFYATESRAGAAGSDGDSGADGAKKTEAKKEKPKSEAASKASTSSDD